MSLARLHRERILAEQAHAAAPHDGEAHVSAAEPLPAAETTTADITTGGSLARQHMAKVLAAQTVAAADGGDGAEIIDASPADRAARQMALRLTHDLRRLKEIKAVSAKSEAKRQMLPEYGPWVSGIIAADKGVGSGIAADVVPTMMVWLIDVALYDDALDILPFLLRHNVAMPSRYNRDAPTIVVEEIADAALKAQAVGAPFALSVLERIEELTAGIDMHDEVRAKLAKAIGSELLRQAETEEADAGSAHTLTMAIIALKQAQVLNDRVGVKDRVKRAEKLLAANIAVFPPPPPSVSPEITETTETVENPETIDTSEQAGETAS